MKYFILLLVSFSYALFLGHSILPHHHHVAEHHHHHDQDGHHHHHDNAESDAETQQDDSEYPLAHSIHADNGSFFLNNYEQHSSLLKIVASIPTLPETFSSESFVIPPLRTTRQPEHPFIPILHHSLSSGLRAPPIAIS